MNNKFNKSDVVLYKNGDTYELGIINTVLCRVQMFGKEWRVPLHFIEDDQELYIVGYDYFVFYHTGSTTALTSEELLIPIKNIYAFNIIRKSAEDDIKYSPARQMASRMLGQTELYGEFYYKMEDWLTKFLEGDEHDLPSGIDREYLKCALRIEVSNHLDSYELEYDSDLVEYFVDKLVQTEIFKSDFIERTINDYLRKKGLL